MLAIRDPRIRLSSRRRTKQSRYALLPVGRNGQTNPAAHAFAARHDEVVAVIVEWPKHVAYREKRSVLNKALVFP